MYFIDRVFKIIIGYGEKEYCLYYLILIFKLLMLLDMYEWKKNLVSVLGSKNFI